MKQQRKIFITGTDTEVGKTFFTTALIRAMQNARRSVMAFKPVAAGCEVIDGQLKNDDALKIIQALQGEYNEYKDPLCYQQINPIALQSAIAPHIAALDEGRELSIASVKQVCDLSAYSQDYILVEGAGGWLVPLNQEENFADYVIAEQLDVILVVGLKLGCINHALLTQKAIKQSGLNLIGWVANHIDPNMQNQQQNVDYLIEALNCPLVAEIPFLNEDNCTDQASRYVRIETL